VGITELWRQLKLWDPCCWEQQKLWNPAFRGLSKMSINRTSTLIFKFELPPLNNVVQIWGRLEYICFSLKLQKCQHMLYCGCTAITVSRCFDTVRKWWLVIPKQKLQFHGHQISWVSEWVSDWVRDFFPQACSAVEAMTEMKFGTKVA